MSNTDTPLTDENAQFIYGRIDRKWCSVEFARGLERENARLQKKITKLIEQWELERKQLTDKK